MAKTPRILSDRDAWEQWRFLTQQAETMERPLRRAWLAAIKSAETNQELWEFLMGVNQRNIKTKVKQFERRFANHLTTTFAQTLANTQSTGATASASGTYTTAGRRIGTVTIDTATRRAERWAQRWGGQLISDMAQKDARAIADAVGNAIRRGIGEHELASQIKKYVGLHQPYQNAVDNYVDGLLNAGTAPGEASRLGRQYADQLRETRAQTIARTESMRAVNAGRLELWEEAQANGDLPKNQQMIWVTSLDERTCPYCEVLDGMAVQLGKDFSATAKVSYSTKTAKKVKVIADIPPLHVNCRCIIILEKP